MLKLINQGILRKTHELSLSHCSLPGRSPLFFFCYCFKTATSQGTNGKKCHGICLLWIQFKSKPQRWSITKFWSELIKSRDSQTCGEVLEKGMERLESRGVQQPQKVGQKSRKHNIWEMVENEWVRSVWKMQRGHSLTVHKPMNEKREVIDLCVSYGKETKNLALELQQRGDVRHHRASCSRWRRGALEEVADGIYGISIIREF